MDSHRVNSVQALHESAMFLYNNVVVGSDKSADAILNNLQQGIDNLKNNWKGKDAGVRILEVIKVHNGMVAIRNALAQLAVDSSMVAANYREIQNANGAGLESLGTLSFEAKSVISEDYVDTADTVNINPAAEAGKRCIDDALNTLEAFHSAVSTSYDEIMSNWTSGGKRQNAEDAFSLFMSNVSTYRQTLLDVSTNISKALQNYTF